MARFNRWTGYGEALASVMAVTVAWRLLLSYGTFLTNGAFSEEANITTVVLSYLLAVLITASRRGLGPGVLASAVGTFCFDFFFLPPIYVINPKDPHDWVALSAFLFTANLASRLWAASLSREQEAQWRREQALKLYGLSCAIIVHPDPESLIASIAQEVLDAFGYCYCGLFQRDDGGVWRSVSVAHARSAPVSALPKPEVIEMVYRTGNPAHGEVSNGPRSRSHKKGRTRAIPNEVDFYVPLKAGANVIAVLVSVVKETEVETMDAIGSLVALALERVRLLKEIQIKDALKQSDKLKSALLASVSHNLRTPLTSIRASVDSIIAADADGGDPNVHELHVIISEEVNRLSRIVDNLLEMARVEAGELRPRKEWTSTSEIYDNALLSCEAVLRHHRLRFDCPETVPLVRVDPRMMTEVLVNLLDNAAKYSPPGSEIVVSARTEGNSLRLSVEDRGPGIDARDAERIFEKFYRVTQPNHQMKDGTGMGLAIARGLVEAHSGKIWVESSAGSGATFVITVPAEQVAARESTLEVNKS